VHPNTSKSRDSYTIREAPETQSSWPSGALIWVLSLLMAPVLLVGQNLSPAETTNTVKGQKLFTQLCSGCHGADGYGTQQGPALVGNRRVRARSLQALRDLIHNGIPVAGMPAFALSNNELSELASLVHSLNAPAAESAMAGDPAPGERFFFGEGRCASCHMVKGRGKPVGPDLSNVGRERSVDEIRTALLQPSARITAGYEIVTVKLRSRKTIRGFARSRSNFDVVLQDFDGKFHMLHDGEVASITAEKQSLMPAVDESSKEFHNLMIYLSRLSGVKPGIPLTAESKESGGIDFSRIVKPEPGDWLSYNGKLSANRYSDLTQINTANVKNLHVKWTFAIPLFKQFYPATPYFLQKVQSFVLEVTPLVANGVMYMTGPNSVYALDASNGQEIWEYSRPRSPAVMTGDAALGTNRGVAILGDKVFMVTNDAHLIALNRTTGRLVWEAVMPDEPQHYGSTVAPLIVKDMVVAGVSGGDWGIRGFISAYKASTGERVWRHWTVPATGEPGVETWGRKAPAFGGGATWLTGSYDPDADTLYWSTGNPFPDSNDRDRPGDNLFTNCILALSPDTGETKWYYQFTPHDTHDWDSVQPPVLVDTRYQGKDRKLLLLANRNGFFYVLDRLNGHVLLAKSFIKRLTWASGIGQDGRPDLLTGGDETCPKSATNWNATAFSPVTRLYYVMAQEQCVVKLSPLNWEKTRPPEEPGKQYLRALDIDTGKIAWEIPEFGPPAGTDGLPGVLATAGGIVFHGDPAGNFVAVDERKGKELWHFSSSGIFKSSPMTYLVDGRQYVAIAAGSQVICFGLP
jgi:PQQ-dependent dehydrogenase (methanol/ethanol family)